MNDRFLYTGSLASMPVPEALATIERYRVPGVVTVETDGIEKKIYLSNGLIHFASSSAIDDRLGEYLLDRGVISQEQYDESVVQLKQGRGRQGRILVSMGAMTPKDLYVHIRDQVRHIVYSVFSLRKGTLNFSVGTFKEEEIIKLNFPVRKVILEGIKTVNHSRFLVARMGSKGTVFSATPDEQTLKDIALTEEESALFSMVDGKKPLYSLVTKGPFEPETNAKILYAFFCLKLIQAKETDGIIKVQLK